jgi:hypothetical protein
VTEKKWGQVLQSRTSFTGAIMLIASEYFGLILQIEPAIDFLLCA